MADVHTKETRSYNMSRIKSKDTRPVRRSQRTPMEENYWCDAFYMPMATGTGYTIKNSPANPILFYQNINRNIWACLPAKNGNIANDEKAAKALKKEGWKIISLWECELKPLKAEKTLFLLKKNCKNKRYQFGNTLYICKPT
ncbi:MAG TPA: hypothetical protein VNS50_08255 [Ginsengibacter sp.]|nr:hypothetical protein [Ginsengibacter sp.]